MNSNKISRMIRYLITMGFLFISISTNAVTQYDQNVTPDVIFGTGNPNGGFTTDRSNNIEVGLRLKIPFTTIINSNGDGTYSFSAAELATGTPPGVWNFEFTVNTHYNTPSGPNLNNFTYELGLDADPSLATNFLVFDPITPTAIPPFYDHSIGDNSTANGGGTEAGDAATYVSLLLNNNVLQQSWRYGFFTALPPLNTFDPSIPGTYAIYFLVRDMGGNVVGRSDIQVLIDGAHPVISPSAVPSLGLTGILFLTLLLGAFAFNHKRKLVRQN